MRTSTVIVTLALWFVTAALVVATGSFAQVTVPPPAIIVMLATVTVLWGMLWPGARTWIQTVDLRYLFAVHFVRFVGAAFLVLVSRGVLAREFVPIGWGDTIAAIGAVALFVSRPRLSTRVGWWCVLVWNCIGFGDMLMLIVTGVRLGSVAPEKFALFLQLPFGLLPTFFVPLIIASHMFIFMRLFASRSISH